MTRLSQSKLVALVATLALVALAPIAIAQDAPTGGEASGAQSGDPPKGAAAPRGPMMLISPGTFYAFVFGFAILTYAALRVLEAVGFELWKKGKVRLLDVDPDGAANKIVWKKPSDNTVHIKRGKEATSVILQAEARLPGKWPIYVVHARHGWNYKFLGDAETVDKDKRLALASLSNPLSYHKAMTRKGEWADALNANQEPDDAWKRTLVLAACFIAVVFALVIGYAFYIVAKSGAV